MDYEGSLVSVSLENALKERSSDFEELIQRSEQHLRSLLFRREESGMGWINYPSSTNSFDLNQQRTIAQELASLCDTIVVIGIGGSYVGAKSILASLEPFYPTKENQYPELIFAGNYLSGEVSQQLLDYLQDRSIGLIVVSKSGNTLEPFIAFSLLEKLLYERYGKEEACKRIVVITDPEKGALREIATTRGYTSLAIPSSIGGRFSVLSPAGLLPACLRGLDITALMEGAVAMERELLCKKLGAIDNPAIRYAASRQFLYQHQGKKIELFTSFDPYLSNLGEWWKQLFAESEGKEGKGIFVSTATFTTDLHSVGQWIQQGERTIFETILSTKSSTCDLLVPAIDAKDTSHHYLSGMDLSHIERSAEKGTIEAHVAGGVPVIQIRIPSRKDFYIGALLYFFELAVAISGSLMEINPFDQPGVEAYKNRMYSLLKRNNNKE